MRQPGKCTRLQQHWEQKVSVNRRLHLLPERGSMLVPKNPSGAPPAATASPGASQWPHGHGAASRTQQRVGVNRQHGDTLRKGKQPYPIHERDLVGLFGSLCSFPGCLHAVVQLGALPAETHSYTEIYQIAAAHRVKQVKKSPWGCLDTARAIC